MAQRFEVVSVDLFGPLVETEAGNRWILIVEDTATRWVELFALKQATAEIVAKTLINDFFLRYGLPRRLVSDNGAQFVCSVMQCVAHCFDFEQKLTPLYHPEANMVERRNRDLKTQLSILVGNDHRSWDDHLATIRFAINTTVCSGTDRSAAYLTFGSEIRSFGDISRDFRLVLQDANFVPQITPFLFKMDSTFKDAKEVHEMEQDKRKQYADSKRRIQEIFKEGELILLNTHVLSNAAKGISSKFAPKREGPYRIRRCKSNSVFEVEDMQGKLLGT